MKQLSSHKYLDNKYLDNKYLNYKRFGNKRLLIGLFSLGLLLATPQTAKAQMAAKPDTNEFRRIEQPLGLKVGVAAAGVGLAGLELWWFLLSKNEAIAAEVSEGIQAVDIADEPKSCH